MGGVVPKERELVLSFQLVIQSFSPSQFYGPVRLERLRCQSGHQHKQVIQRVRQNLFKLQ